MLVDSFPPKLYLPTSTYFFKSIEIARQYQSSSPNKMLDWQEPKNAWTEIWEDSQGLSKASQLEMKAVEASLKEVIRCRASIQTQFTGTFTCV